GSRYAAEALEAAVVFGLYAHFARETAHGFEVVRHHLRAYGQHTLQVIPLTFEVGDKRLQRRFRTFAADGVDGLRPDGRPAVFQVVAVDRSDHAVFHLHELHRLRHTIGLVEVDSQGPPGGNRTE